MNELTLLGPFLTRRSAAARLGLLPLEVSKRPELLRITGMLQECYFAFQCRDDALGRDLGRIALAMKGAMGDQEIADWLITRNPHLKDVSPLGWLSQRWGLPSVMEAASRRIDSPAN